MIDVVLQSLEDAKAEQTVAIDIAGKSSLADHMVVTSGRSNRHVSAVADQVVKALRDNGFTDRQIVDIALAAGVRNFFSRTLQALAVPVEDVPGLSPELTAALLSPVSE